MARPKAGSPSKKQKVGKGKKGSKKAKDPNAPKKPTTAFFYFVKSRRDQGLDQGKKVADFTKECGALWQELKDRTKFDKLAQSDRERYDKEMKAYKPSGGGGGDEPPKPKKASTAFILFANAKRADLMAEGFSAKEVLQEAGRMWKEMKDKDKSEFVAAADEDRKRYNKDMEKYNEELRNSRKNGAKKPVAKKPPSDDEDDDDDDDDDEDMESDDE